MSWADRIERASVCDGRSLSHYAQQELGIPHLNGYEIAAFNKSLREFFVDYPDATYETLCKVVDWAKANNRRFKSAISLVQYGLRGAFQDKYLPELEPGNRKQDKELDERIAFVLRIESDETWRNRLILAAGAYRQTVYDEWMAEQRSLAAKEQ